MSNPEINKKVINKTKNIVSATILVMSVSDNSNTSNQVKERATETALNLLDFVQGIRHLTPVYKNKFQADAYNQIDALLDYLHVGYSVGVISRMNVDILAKELHSLRDIIASATNISSMQNEGSHIEISHTLFDDFIANAEIGNEVLPDPKLKNEKLEINTKNIKDKIIQTSDKGHMLNQNLIPKRTLVAKNYISNNEKRKNRKDLILDFITERRLQGKTEGVMVKDILMKIKDVSEKTLQRELSALVAKGVLKKIGDKRWSRYV